MAGRALQEAQYLVMCETLAQEGSLYQYLTQRTRVSLIFE